MKNEKYDKKWKELAVRGKPRLEKWVWLAIESKSRWKDENAFDWQWRVSPDEKMKMSLTGDRE